MLTCWLDWRGEESGAALRWAFLNAHFQTGLRNLLDAAILRSGRWPGVAAPAVKLGPLPCPAL